MGRIAPSSGALRGGTHLREEANEKWAGVLGEKLRGLSRGLLPAGERRALGSFDHQNKLLGTAHPSSVGPCMYGRPRPFCSGPASLNIFGGSRFTELTQVSVYSASSKTAPPFSSGSSFLLLQRPTQLPLNWVQPTPSIQNGPAHKEWPRPGCGPASYGLNPLVPRLHLCLT